MTRGTILLLIMLTTLHCTAREPKDTLKHHAHTAQDEIVRFHHLNIGNNNTAALSLRSKSYISVEFQNDYFLKELMKKRITGQISYADNNFSISIMHFGYLQYGEYQVGAGYTRKFGRKTAISMMFYYIGNHARNYGIEHSITFDISLYYDITPKIGLGVRAFNPAHLRYGISDESAPHLPMIFNFDLHYKVSRSILLFSFIEKDIGTTVKIGVGGIYSPLKIFCIQGKVSFPNPEMELSARINLKHLELGAGVLWRVKLGVSPCMKIYFPLKKHVK